MQPTPAILIRLNRAPTRRKAAPSCNRPNAMTKHGMPPTQMAAPSMCTALAASRRPDWSSRAAAWVVAVAAARMTATSASNNAAAGLASSAGLGAGADSSSPASTKAAAIFTSPATANPAPTTPESGMSNVSINTAACIATVNASQAANAMALHPAMKAVRRTNPAPSGRVEAKGRARKIRKITPPRAMDCATMTSPCRMIER